MNTHARHRWFDRGMGAGSPNILRLVQEGLALVARYEDDTGARQRRRKPQDEANHRTMVEAVVANLAHTVLLPDTGHRAVLIGKPRQPRTRYDHHAFGDTFPTVLRTLEGIGWATFHLSPAWGDASTIEPTPRLAAKVQEAGIALHDLKRDAGETVLLSRKERHGRKVDAFTWDWIDYPETAQSAALRGQMESLNAFLDKADLRMEGEAGEKVDTHQRQQRRYFTVRDATSPCFDRGGRMFGGWWSNLLKAYRPGIRVDGEPVSILDFSSMFPRLAYGSLGLQAPDGDLYDLPGFHGHRRAAKLIMNCFLFDEHHRCRWPQVSAPEHAMPPGMTLPQARRSILSVHPDLAPCFGKGLGHQLMFTESTILMEVLMEMKTKGVVGLGLHDGLMVPRSRAPEVERIMGEVSQSITSIRIPVTVEPAEQHFQSNLQPTSLMRAISPCPTDRAAHV
ncbi:hypothetical protein [Methylorubrum extorquens]|uniref:DNA-directed DNA polymerase family A palm domain-containing protein n=1 Tax=Methylorubrum extorquens TaxID=408 RepID=A0AAX3WDY8_METEX|nr:hypothetical protein [Methylorubrum extorquens]WHQ68870.1 hypothetical protein KEC54_21365 [Methylorubrum extorquens]